MNDFSHRRVAPRTDLKHVFGFDSKGDEEWVGCGSDCFLTIE
jgi:hypothetical protein